jgi:hypothetical protein
VGVLQDHKEALRWYRKAANQGDAAAQYNLAGMYATGEGTARDLAEARKWMQKAAASGDADAREWLAAHPS